jgi:hypothetical protein
MWCPIGTAQPTAATGYSFSHDTATAVHTLTVHLRMKSQGLGELFFEVAET